MPHTFFAHTGDLAVRLNGRSLDEVFSAAAASLLEAVTDPGAVRAADEARISLRAEAPDLLLRDFLAELLFDLDARGRLVAEVEAAVTRDVDSWFLEARTRGERLDPARHPVKVLVKGITYHALSVTQSADGWTATVVLDI
jgi:SHS2 domain-containing protein